MSTQSRDTDPHAEAIQISLLRSAGTSRGLGLARSLSRTAIRLSRRAIASAHPGMNDRERMLLWVQYHYGHDLETRLAVYLRGRAR